MEEKAKRVRVYTEAQKERKRESERKRMENPEYRERKRLVDRNRLENKEVRERKQAMDRDRQKRVKHTESRLVSAKKHRESEKFKMWAANHQKELTEKAKEDAIVKRVGVTCPILFVLCECCGTLSVKSVVAVGVSIVKSTHCNACAKGKRIPRTVDVVCVDCGSVCQGSRGKKRCKRCAKSEARQKDRLRGSGTYIDRVSVNKVYERDGWKCQSCGCKVIGAKAWMPNRATIDHTIPVTRGGSHTYENIKTMCAMCNSTKNDTMPIGVQLSVFDMVR